MSRAISMMSLWLTLSSAVVIAPTPRLMARQYHTRTVIPVMLAKKKQRKKATSRGGSPASDVLPDLPMPLLVPEETAFSLDSPTSPRFDAVMVDDMEMPQADLDLLRQADPMPTAVQLPDQNEYYRQAGACVGP
jgi:hypothetical protein